MCTNMPNTRVIHALYLCLSLFLFLSYIQISA